jgi:hypothetical protein
LRIRSRKVKGWDGPVPQVEASSGSIAVRKDDGDPAVPHPDLAEIVRSQPPLVLRL